MRLRHILGLTFAVALLAEACAETTEGVGGGDEPADAAVDGASTKPDAKTSDGATGTEDGEAPDDASTNDAGKGDATTLDASAQDANVVTDATVVVDATKPDTGTASDGSPPDGALGASDASVVPPVSKLPDGGACPGTIVNPTCAVPSGNLARCGTAAASSVYSTSWPEAHLNDGLLDTSWYSAVDECPAGVCANTLYAEVEFNAPRAVRRVKLYGNGDTYQDGYDVLTARIQLIDGGGNVVGTADVTTTRGADPNGNAEVSFVNALPCIKKVRVIPLTMQTDNTGPGIGEIEAFAN